MIPPLCHAVSKRDRPAYVCFCKQRGQKLGTAPGCWIRAFCYGAKSEDWLKKLGGAGSDR
jgi:hypothetical protein